MASTTSPPAASKTSAPDPLPPPHKYDSAIGWLRHILFGRALATSRTGETQIPIVMALPILSSNALSSVAYATEAILLILFFSPAGTGAYPFSVPIAIAICALLVIVTLSYIQIIHAYPEGGGAYPVSRDNLNTVASLIAGASLMVDYLLTVAVSVAAGVAAIIGMFAGSRIGPILQDEVVPICLVAILGLTVANLRGLKEAGLLFAVPCYAFIVSIIATIIVSLAAIWTHAPYVQTAVRVGHENAMHAAQSGLQAVGIILILQAFSQGCSALTGMEAISNTVPVFQKPQVKNAVTAMYWMSGLAVVMFLGITYISSAFGATYMDARKPGYESVIGQVANTAWPASLHFMFYVVQITTAIILVIAANTAFAGFPQLASMMSVDGFLPRQLSYVGDRLAFNNGIILLALFACGLIIIFRGLVDALLPMYAIGVFIGFTLAQTGMVRRWLRLRTRGWQTSLTFNALGALATGLVVLIIAISKFDNGDKISPYFHFGKLYPHYGVWLVMVLVPVLVTIFLKIKRHYIGLNSELSLEHRVPKPPSRNVVLVLVPRLHRGVVNALEYARLIGGDVRAVYIETDPTKTAMLKQDWEKYGDDIPLVIMESPYRSLIGPLTRYIDTVQKERTDDVLTVVLPELVSHKWWHRLLHNQYAPVLRLAISSRRDVVLSSVRYFLES